jgi:hypothetical protein
MVPMTLATRESFKSNLVVKNREQVASIRPKSEVSNSIADIRRVVGKLILYFLLRRRLVLMFMFLFRIVGAVVSKMVGAIVPLTLVGAAVPAANPVGPKVPSGTRVAPPNTGDPESVVAPMVGTPVPVLPFCVSTLVGAAVSPVGLPVEEVGFPVPGVGEPVSTVVGPDVPVEEVGPPVEELPVLLGVPVEEVGAPVPVVGAPVSNLVGAIVSPVGLPVPGVGAGESFPVGADVAAVGLRVIPLGGKVGIVVKIIVGAWEGMLVVGTLVTEAGGIVLVGCKLLDGLDVVEGAGVAVGVTDPLGIVVVVGSAESVGV